MITIYGIYDNDLLLYIGSTSRDNIQDRFKEHKRDLIKGKHTNKTLQKYYNNCENKDYKYKSLYQIKEDNSLLKFFLEMLTISLYMPKCNRCVIKVGMTNLSLKKCNRDLAEKLIQTIVNYC